MTSRMSIECDYCSEKLECLGMSEFYEAGWVELSVGGDDFDTECLDFCSKECCFLYLDEEWNGETTDEEEINE